MLRTLYTIILCLFVYTAVLANGSLYATKSALSEGKWVKIQISQNGFYKLTYSDLKKMGFSDPTKVSIHGYGGWPMEEDFLKAIYRDDVPSVPVYRGDDYILFYGKGTIKWSYDSSAKCFVHENNAYSNYGYYFVTDATETNEVTSKASVTGTASLQITTYDDYMLHEKDKSSVTVDGRPYSGRELFGESFDSNISQTFPFSIPGITNDDGIISFRFISRIVSGTGTGTVTMKVNDSQLTQKTIKQVSEKYDTYTAATNISPKVTWSGEKSETTKVNISFSYTQQKNSYLDYIRLQMKRQLQPYDACTFFRSVASIKNISKFTIQNASSNILVFDITEGKTMQKMETELSGTDATFTIAADTILHEFAMVDISKTLLTPSTVGEVTAQNLHGMEQTDMIILAQPALVTEAERLAKAHTSHDNLKVAVVTPEQVYNEFSSGAPEATAIRRFMKMFYDRKTSDSDAPKYLLLFGDGIYDNRQLTDATSAMNLDNYLLTYQSEESIGEHSYVSDDYFGYLRDKSGSNLSTDSINIGIGRFPISTSTQASNAVDKIITYMENSNLDSWKNRLCFVADDGNSNDYYSTLHATQSNQLASYVEEYHPEYISKKLFFDAYKISYSGGKPTYPDIRTNIQKELKDGLFLINYTGHGDAESWAEEKVMTQTDIVNATYTKLPLWIIAACDFAPYDAATTSAGEDVFLNKKSGGIGIFATTRVAYPDPNFQINMLFLKNLFTKKNGSHLTLGEVVKNTKNSYLGSEKLGFALLGDPALTLAYPEYSSEITEINGEPVSETTINFKALEEVTIKGQILSPDGTKASDFKGLLSTTVFDSQDSITTLDNNSMGKTITYTDYPNTIYIGNDSVRNGEFSFSFTVPKDISYSYKKGKINLYASNDSGNEANGSYKNYTLGGTSTTDKTDTVGPEIRALYLNTSDFKDGDFVNNTPMLGAILWDESGINVGGSSIGHDITLTIDSSSVLSYSLNDYYETYLAGNDGEGIVKFSIPSLEEGYHTAELKVWDILNNSSSKTFGFVVSPGFKPSIIDLTAGPVPARNYVTFMISHNLPETSMTVQIQVFDMTGRLEWKYEESGTSDMFESYKIKWHLTDGAGSRLRPGIYVYRAIISSGSYKEASKAKKLIILAQ